MLSPDRNYTLNYFQPHELAFVVTHQGQPQPTDAQIDGLLRASREALRTETLPQKISSFNFPATPSDCYDSRLQDGARKPAVTPQVEFSLIFAKATGTPGDQIEFFKLLVEVDKQLQGQPVPGLTVKAVSPNWFTSGTYHGSVTGGPASWPVPYRGAPLRAPFPFHLLRDDHPVKLIGQAEGVDVAILDTAYTQAELEAAYTQWHDQHPLINSLLRGGPLEPPKLVPAGTFLAPPLGASEHDYKMNDHGLFAAGIVHTLAPCAKIHLYQVLDEYGVGNINSVAWGFDQVVQHIRNASGRLVVVNCSFVLDLPLQHKHCYTYLREDKECFLDPYTQFDQELEWLILSYARDPAWLQRQISMLEMPCNLIYTLNSRVIAAAGNDWRPERGGPRPRARYPASFDSVQGVGALPKAPRRSPDGRRKSASYSNLADKPTKIGVTTLGGEEGESQGVLGLYLGEFPGGEANRTRWAWWAGTSFATPIVSGVTAAMLSSIPGLRPRAVQEAIDGLYDSGLMQESATVDEEDILEVIQGYLM